MMPFELQDFHFIRPLWLLAIVPLLMMLFGLKYVQKQQSGWQGVIANHLYSRLISVQGGTTRKPPLYLLGLGWVLASLALAGPTWERLPQPVYQLHTGKVVILDMSLSMRATDIKPNRLSRAKFKAIDLIKQAGEGEIGLIAYAGDAFVISPLSTDIQNLTSLIPSLVPEIMPILGSEPLYAFEEAIQLLSNSGYKKGEIFWVTDGIDLSQVAPVAKLLAEHDYRLSILGVGTEDGAPIKLSNNEFLKDNMGAIVVPRFNDDPLELLASKGHGRYTNMQPSDKDIIYLTQQLLLDRNTQEQEETQNNFGDQWKEMGPYLILILLPFAAFAFRRGILVVLLCSLLPMFPKPAYAGWWQDMWQRPDQQGMQSFEQEKYADAAQQFDNPMWKGSSAYKNGNYEQAIEHFSHLDTVESNYNLGNALANAGKTQEAIEAYEKALEKDPQHADAAANKALLEQMQKEQQEQQQQDSEDDPEKQDGDSDQEQQKGEDDQGQQNSDNQQNQDQEQEQDEEGSQSDQQEEPQSSDPEEQQSEAEAEEDEQEQEDSSANEQREQEAEQSEEETEQQLNSLQEELTDEQKEQQQKMENLLRKVPDDPAFLLKRKMLLEQERRKRQRLPSHKQRIW